mgnify:CR=1 FL=1
MQSTANLPVIGLDLAKSVFQLHIVDIQNGEIQRRQIKRAKLTEFFAKCQRSLVAMEACGTAHHWARVISSLGHQVKLLPAQHVKAFLLRDKTDAMDAQAIWVAAQQPHIKPVPVKSERQQTCLGLHAMRRQLMKMRIMQTNALRGILAEFGIALPKGHNQLLKTVQGELAKAQQADQLSADLVVSVQEQLKRIDALQDDIEQLGQLARHQAAHGVGAGAGRKGHDDLDAAFGEAAGPGGTSAQASEARAQLQAKVTTIRGGEGHVKLRAVQNHRATVCR